MSTLPVIDLQDFTGGPAARRDAFVATLGQSLEHLGFVAVEGHNISSELIQRAFDCAHGFFSQPVDVRRNYHRPELNGQRGFTGFGVEHAKDSPAPDLKEFYQIGREPDPNAPSALNCSPNLWPTEVPEFGTVMSELYGSLEFLAQRLLEACSDYLGERAGFLRDLSLDADSILRVIHYPPLSDAVDDNSMRAAPHEDINLITLLCGATAEGLQICDHKGNWSSVESNDRQVIVDSGDMLQNLTNGLLRSTTHRVVVPAERQQERYSLPFFVHPRKDVDLSPLPGCVAKTGGTQKYRSITAGKYLNQRLREIGLSAADE